MLMRDNYEFLSNFYTCPITITLGDKTLTFRNAEAAFQAQKNYSLAEKFCFLTAYEAKKYGRQIPITTENWDVNRLYAMARVLNEKFKDVKLMNKLLAVTEPIVEDNYWNDTFWGVCTNRAHNHEGKNMLGKMLTNIKENNNNYMILINYIDNVLIKEL